MSRTPKIFKYTFYMIVANICTCIGSIDLIFSKIGLPSNFELTIFKESNSTMGSPNNDGIRELFLDKLYPKTSISVLNSEPFRQVSGNSIEQNVQLLYLFLLEDPATSFKVFEQFDNASNGSSESPAYFWRPLYIFIWPANCERETNKTNCDNSFEKNLVELSKKFTLKDDVYILSIPCERNRTVSDILIWEFYMVSNTSVVHRFGFTLGKADNAWHILGNKISRRKNFEGARISATAPDDIDYSQESKFVQNSTSKFESGTSVLRYWFLRDGLNFTEHAVPDSWTSEDENGLLTGGGVKVMNGDVDISISQSPLTESKQRYIDFLQPTDESILRAFFIQPAASKYRDIFISPFKADLWIAMFSTWLLITMSLRIFAWIQQKGHELNIDDNEIVSDSWIWAIGTACQQGWHIQPVSLSIRIAFALGHLTGLVCFAAYSASIVSFLSVKAEPMKTFSDLLNNSFRIFANENSTPIAFILPELRMQKNFPTEVLIQESVSIPKIMNTRSATVAYEDVFSVESRLLNFTDKTICETIDSVRINIVALRSGMIVRKGSPFREFFNYQIMLMLEGGLNYRYLAQYNTGTEASCLQFTTGHKQALGILDVLTAGIILGIGYFLSSIIFIFEIFWARKSRFVHSLMM